MDCGESVKRVGVCRLLSALLTTEFVLGESWSCLPLDLQIFSEVGCCPCVDLSLELEIGGSGPFPLIAKSLAAALSAEQRLPNTSGSDETGEVSFEIGWVPVDLRVTLAGVAAVDSTSLVAFLSDLLRPLLFLSPLSLMVSSSKRLCEERVRRLS